MKHPLGFFLLLMFSSFVSAQTEVFFVYSPDCSHCVEVHPYFAEVSQEFGDGMTFAELNVKTEEGANTAAILGWSWSIGTPAVYFDSDLVILGSRPDFKQALESEICEKINFEDPACEGVTNPDLLYFIVVVFLLALAGVLYVGRKAKK